ncbi:unnamed protein product, partial [marine sediment metagenome]
ELKNKYVRSVIKLGNSKAITFPQDWTEKAGLKEKSEVIIYPIDESSIVIKTADKDKQKTILNIGLEWPIELIKQALISGFKLDVDEIYIKYSNKNQDEIFDLLTQLRGEIIGMDMKELPDTSQFLIYFLTDTSKMTIKDVLMELINTFSRIISNVIEGKTKKNNELLLSEIDRKYSLGRRILITGLSDYPVSKGYRNLPVIQFLGNRVVLIYVKDFINESLNLQYFPSSIIKKYSDLLTRIPSLLIDIVNNYDNINLNTISEFHDELNNLSSIFNKIKPGDTFEDLELRKSIQYFLNSFQNFFDIGITRLIETEIGMV